MSHGYADPDKAVLCCAEFYWSTCGRMAALVTIRLYDTDCPCALTKQSVLSCWSLLNRMLIVVNDVDENIDIFIASVCSIR